MTHTCSKCGRVYQPEDIQAERCVGCGASVEALLQRHDVPPDILKALEVDTASLDDAVHDEKSQEATGINNDGFWAQLDYLKANGWSWDMVRDAIGIPKEGL